jgi:hypothetical protein
MASNFMKVSSKFRRRIPRLAVRIFITSSGKAVGLRVRMGAVPGGA